MKSESVLTAKSKLALHEHSVLQLLVDQEPYEEMSEVKVLENKKYIYLGKNKKT